MPNIARRSLAVLALGATAAAKAAPAAAVTDFTPIPLPVQHPAKTAVAALPNANLGYWTPGAPARR